MELERTICHLIPMLARHISIDCAAILLALLVLTETGIAQGLKSINAPRIVDYDPATELGDPVFGSLIADMENDHAGRCSHGGPVCLQYANGDIAAFYANTSDHNIDGWTEYALSHDGGKTWDRYNPLPYSLDAYQRNPDEPAWVEEGLVTAEGTAILFVTQMKDLGRASNSILRSHDDGKTWSKLEPFEDEFVGYPCAVAVSGQTNYVLLDSKAGPHVLYVSTDDGRTWQCRSKLSLDDELWYGTMCLMKDGRILAGAYKTGDEGRFHYCISNDGGHSWEAPQSAVVDQKIRDPELAYFDGKYYLHGRTGSGGEGAHRFVIYQSIDGEDWGPGLIVSSDDRGPDGYSHNCVVRPPDQPDNQKLMVVYSIIYAGKDTNEYVFFLESTHAADQASRN